MHIRFLTEEHAHVFNQLLEEAYVQLEDTPLMRRQLAFLYMLTYYQKEYEAYEGEGFYIEAFEDLEIGGPTYLLEDAVNLRADYPHEYIIYWAKALLRGQMLGVDTLQEDARELYQEALQIANISSAKIG